jgi:hypothetical protein
MTSRKDLFLSAFASAFETRAASEGDLGAVYRDARRWTSFMLGASSAHEQEGALRAAASHWAGELAPDTFSVHTQWYTLDLSIVSPPYDDARDYWATRTLLAVEHENGDDVETEMWKLAHWRADLSVLVFYDFAEADLDDRPYRDRSLAGVSRRNWLVRKLDLLTEIVTRIDRQGAERHLLLIGCRDRGGAVRWRASRWRGDRFCLPEPISIGSNR